MENSCGFITEAHVWVFEIWLLAAISMYLMLRYLHKGFK